METTSTRNRDSSTRSTRKERPERLGGKGGGEGGGGGGHQSSSGERRRHNSVTNISAGHDDDDDSSRSHRKKKKERAQRAQRKMDSDMNLALLSDDDNEDEPVVVEKKRPSRLIPSNPTVTEGLSTVLEASGNGRHQEGDAVEARFGGRSKWFTGKVRRAYESPPDKVLYDIAYDDGDNEDGVQAGRVRGPGQIPPRLRAGLAVELKLARKGKGYFPGTIGRVNDDGSLYVKLADGDSEWSASPQQVIPLYPYEPTELSPSSGDKSPPESSKHDSAERAGGGARGGGDDAGDANGDDRRASSPTDGEQASNVSAVVGEGGAFKSALADLSVRAQEDAGTGREDLTETTPSNPDTAASASRESTSANASGRDNSDLTRQESQDPSSVLAVASSAPLDGERQAGWHDAGRVAAKDSPVDGSLAKSSTGPNAVEPRSCGGPGGITEPIKTHVGGPTVKSPGGLGMARSASTAGGQTGKNNIGILPPSSPESTPTALDETTATSISSPAREEETSDSNLVTPVAVGVVGTPIASGVQTAGGDETTTTTTTTTGDEGTHGVPTAASRTGREETARPAKVGEDMVPRALDSHCEDKRKDKPGQEKPEAAHGSTNNTSVPTPTPEANIVQEGTNNSSGQSDKRNTALQRNDDPVEPFRAERKAKKVVAEPGSVSHGTSLPPAPLPPQRTSRGPGECTRWDTLRLSVQRRYAAEAMHLSEEVRLLKAKLTTADGQLRAKLAQQERRFGVHMQDALQQERDKAQATLGGHRAASARRISALSEELNVARRHLVVERNRRTKAGSAQKNARGKAASPPKLRPAGQRVPIREKRRDNSTCYRAEDEFGNFTANPITGEERADTNNIIGSLGYEERVGTIAPTITAGDTGAVADGGLAPGSEVVDHLSAGLASTNQSVGELAARLQKLERGGRGERALAAERRGYRMRPTDERYRDSWSDQVHVQGRSAARNDGRRDPWRGQAEVPERSGAMDDGYQGPRGGRAVDRGGSADSGDDHLPVPPTSRRGQKVIDNAEEAHVGKDQRHEEGPCAADVPEPEDATAAAATAAVPEPGDVARLLLSPGIRRGRNSNPVAESTGTAGNHADVYYENPDDSNTDVYSKSPDTTNNNNGVYYQYPDKSNTDIYCKDSPNNGTGIYHQHDRRDLRWQLETERRHTRKVLKAMKGEVARVVGQYRTRAERAEAAAASAERRATVKALQYLRSKRLSPPLSPSLV